LSASKSGISSLNSSSIAITTSTVSKLSSPRSFSKCASGVTCHHGGPCSVLGLGFGWRRASATRCGIEGWVSGSGLPWRGRPWGGS
jgi:hypothetical protein